MLGRRYERARISLNDLGEKLACGAIFEGGRKSYHDHYKPGKYEKSRVFDGLTADALKDLKPEHFNHRSPNPK